MVKKAVIVAAGLSSRLYPLTLEQPKGLLQINGEPLLKRSIEILRENGVNDIAVVTGYCKDKIIEVLGDNITYLFNPFYKESNNMCSLWFAKSFVKLESFIYLHGDIAYDRDILSTSLLAFNQHSYALDLVTDFGPVDEEAMKVKVNAKGLLMESNKEIPLSESVGEWTGIAYIRKPVALFQIIEEILYKEGFNYYDTHAFSRMAQQGDSIFCSSTGNLPWIEIDFLSDYEKAKELFEYEQL